MTSRKKKQMANRMMAKILSDPKFQDLNITTANSQPATFSPMTMPLVKRMFTRQQEENAAAAWSSPPFKRHTIGDFSELKMPVIMTWGPWSDDDPEDTYTGQLAIRYRDRMRQCFRQSERFTDWRKNWYLQRCRKWRMKCEALGARYRIMAPAHWPYPPEPVVQAATSTPTLGVL